LRCGGERGPQVSIIPNGQYRINPRLFSVKAVEVVDVPDNMVGVVTTKEGASLSTGEIAGKEVSGHNLYQNGQAFLDAGGFKGLQEQVILAGRYFINPMFATVEIVEMTKVPIANAGVVIAYVGEEGKDVTGDSFKHGNLVKKGQKGVWVEPLDPGKYPINPYTHKVECVPTANVVRNESLTVIPEDFIGVVESRDGGPLDNGNIIGKHVNCDMFQDARAFLVGGGQRGPQGMVIPEGSYRINTLLFTVSSEKITSIEKSQIGIVEAYGGDPIPSGRVLAKHIDCGTFQDANAFLSGRRLSCVEHW
jgi:uncharacterized membrane protein YqiK